MSYFDEKGVLGRLLGLFAIMGRKIYWYHEYLDKYVDELGGKLMQKILVKSGGKVSGQVQISGAKNAALALIAGALLGSGETVFENVPRIADIEMMLNILDQLG